jgi:F0F1-type ATP synthase assembly protein I
MLESRPVMQDPGTGRIPRVLTDRQIAGLMAQSGCLVVGLLLAAVLAGIWLDRTLNTRPLLTLILVLGTVPVTIFLLFRISMRAISSVKPGAPRAPKDRNDDDEA